MSAELQAGGLAPNLAGLDALLALLDEDDWGADAALGPADPTQAPPSKQKRKPRVLPDLNTSDAGLPPLVLPPSLSVVCSRSAGETDELLACSGFARASLLGLDIEWTVTYVAGVTQRPAAVVQLSSASGCVVAQLSAMRGVFPPRLRALLEDPRVIKSGCKVTNDALKLRRDYGVRCAGLLELGSLAALALPYGERPWALADLCASALRRRLPKERTERMSDWEGRLSYEQLKYAALDAYASREVAVTMLRTLHARHAGSPSPSSRAWGAAASSCPAVAIVRGDDGTIDDTRVIAEGLRALPPTLFAAIGADPSARVARSHDATAPPPR